MARRAYLRETAPCLMDRRVGLAYNAPAYQGARRGRRPHECFRQLVVKWPPDAFFAAFAER